MQRLQTVLQELLREAGALELVKMGPAPAKVSITPEVRKHFEERLLVELKANDRILKAVVALHFFIFLVALGLIYYSKNSPLFVSCVVGGSVFALLAITRSLSNLWQAKMAIDILLVELPRLSGEQVVQIIKDLYYGRMKSPRVKQTDDEREAAQVYPRSHSPHERP